MKKGAAFAAPFFCGVAATWGSSRIILKNNEIIVHIMWRGQAWGAYIESRDKTSNTLCCRLGLAFRRQKKFKEAIENYRKAKAISPDAVIYFDLAIAIAESGDLTQAIGSLRCALVLRPKFSQAEKMLKTLQEKAGHSNEEQVDLSALSRRFP
jgi:tetratricopeptide (TPR) repeat protein